MDIDHELASALAIDPSPAFVARVRARIACEPAPSSYTRQIVMLVGCAVVAIALVVVMPRADRREAMIGAIVIPPQALIPPAGLGHTPLAGSPVRHRSIAQVVHPGNDPGVPAPAPAPAPAPTQALSDRFVVVLDDHVHIVPAWVDTTDVALEPARGETVIAPMSVYPIAPIATVEGDPAWPSL